MTSKTNSRVKKTLDEQYEDLRKLGEDLKRAERLRKRGKQLLIAGGSMIIAGVVGLAIHAAATMEKDNEQTQQ